MTKNEFLYQDLQAQIKELTQQIEELSAKKATAEEDSEILNLFLEHSPVYFFLIDEKVRAVRLSKNFEKLLGFPIEKMIGSAVSSLIKTDTAKYRDTKDLQILDNNVPVQYDDEVMGRITTTYRFPVKMNGKPSYLAGFVIDNTDRVLAERALKENEEKFRSLFNSIPNPVLIVEKQSGKITEVNDNAVTQYGYTRDELVKLDISFLTSDTVTKKINPQDFNDLLLRKFHNKKNGDVFPVSLNITPFKIKNEDFLILSVHDISSQVLSEQHRKELKEKFHFEKLNELEHRLISLNKQLSFQSISFKKQIEISNKIAEMIASLSPNADNLEQQLNHIRNVIISNNLDLKSENIKEHINSQDNEFLKKLKSHGFKLSTNEINLCSYLKLNLSTKEISKITHQSTRSIEVARYKLRKKFNIDKNINLNLFFSSL